MTNRWWVVSGLVLAAGVLASVLLLGFVAAVVYPTLPSLDVLTNYQPKIPLRVYSADGKLIGEFGEERRALVKIADVPRPLTYAILAAED
jgi:penicillin-binding protein 1A